MPIEHEIKHVLMDPDGKLLAALGSVHPATEIDQFYVTPENRFRRSSWLHGTHRTVEFAHTFKKQFRGKLLEVETPVREDDWNLALSGAVERLTKVRFSFERGPVHWDIDFLLTAPLEEGGEVYFAMAEAEFEEGTPYEVAPEIADFVELVVPHGESEWFTNRKLANRDYAAVAVERHRTAAEPATA